MIRTLTVAAAMLLAPASRVVAQAWLVVVTGLPGTPARRAAFDSTASAIVAAARSRLGLPDSHILRLGETTTAAGISSALTALAARVEPAATVCLVLLGHGSALGGEPRLNVQGPDLSAAQLAVLLRRFATQEVVVVNTTSTSGAWLEALAAPKRAIITATRSASERDETVFARYFAQALGAEASDTDKDGRVSVLEVFEAARAGVERHYTALRRLRTEHPLIDDDGNGRGALAGGPDGDGRRSALLFLDGSGTVASGDTRLVALFARRDSLGRTLSSLREQRATMDSTAYDDALERVLIDIARNGREIRQRQVTAR